MIGLDETTGFIRNGIFVEDQTTFALTVNLLMIE